MQNYGRIIALCALVSTLGLLSTVTAAQTDRWRLLRNNAEIQNGVLVIAIGDYIVDNCTTIDARRMPAIGYMMNLANQARDMGFSRGDIVEYVEDDLEKERVRARAVQWLEQRGASIEDEETLCQVGRDEITAGSTIGRLLQGG